MALLVYGCQRKGGPAGSVAIHPLAKSWRGDGLVRRLARSPCGTPGVGVPLVLVKFPAEPNDCEGALWNLAHPGRLRSKGKLSPHFDCDSCLWLARLPVRRRTPGKLVLYKVSLDDVVSSADCVSRIYGLSDQPVRGLYWRVRPQVLVHRWTLSSFEQPGHDRNGKHVFSACEAYCETRSRVVFRSFCSDPHLGRCVGPRYHLAPFQTWG